VVSAHCKAESGAEDRAYCGQVLTKTAEPVLTALADGKLKEALPQQGPDTKRAAYAPLEAFGRTLAGIAPWLELGPDDSAEGKLRARFIDLTVKSLINATDPKSPDYLNFSMGGQPLVDTAFLSLGLLRAPTQVWGKLNAEQKANVIAAMKLALVNKPPESNWLLFPATIEAAQWELTGSCDQGPIEYAVQKHQQWYLGDGTYGDGQEYHWDYYNSYVIHPMLLAVLQVCAEKKDVLGGFYPKELARAQRYAVVQERMISPEGTFPIIGRSSTYRFGAFHLLADVALLHALPGELKAGAVRGGLYAVVRKMMGAPGTYDGAGWLKVGAVGSQPSIAEGYISGGSPYLCLCGLVELGLPADDNFWTAPEAPWTQKAIWGGADLPADHAYGEKK
jgi:hypothetical protein